MEYRSAAVAYGTLLGGGMGGRGVLDSEGHLTNTVCPGELIIIQLLMHRHLCGFLSMTNNGDNIT